MRDADVRAAVHAKVLRDHHDEPSTLVLDELAVWYGAARVDVAVVNGRLHGYEIKSDRDTLDRLPDQQRIYGMVFDRVTIVCGGKHLAPTAETVPVWWGIKVATIGRRGALSIDDVRAPQTNRAVDPVAVAALLWCDELTAILEGHGASRGFKGKSRDVLSRRLAEILSLRDLRGEVRRQLKARTTWRVDRQRT